MTGRGREFQGKGPAWGKGVGASLSAWSLGMWAGSEGGDEGRGFTVLLPELLYALGLCSESHPLCLGDSTM